jgi:hypothetical protein
MQDVDRQIERLTEAIAVGGRLPSLLGRLKTAQAQRDELASLQA